MKNVLYLIGLPGSGKSTLAHALQVGKPDTLLILEKDMIRQELGQPEGTKGRTAFEKIVSAERLVQIKRFMRSSQYTDLVLSDTNLTPEGYEATVAALDETGVPYTIKSMYIDPGVDTCLQRNFERTTPVPGNVMYDMTRKYLKLRSHEVPQTIEVKSQDLWYVGDIHSNCADLRPLVEYLEKLRAGRDGFHTVFLGDIFDARFTDPDKAFHANAGETLRIFLDYRRSNRDAILVDSNHQSKLQKTLSRGYVDVTKCFPTLEMTLWELHDDGYIELDEGHQNHTIYRFNKIDFSSLSFLYTAPYFVTHHYKGQNFVGVHAQWRSVLDPWRNSGKLKGIALYGTGDHTIGRDPWWTRYASIDPFVVFGHYHQVHFGLNNACIDGCSGEDGGYLLAFNPIKDEVIKVKDGIVHHCKRSEFVVDTSPSKAPTGT